MTEHKVTFPNGEFTIEITRDGPLLTVEERELDPRDYDANYPPVQSHVALTPGEMRQLAHALELAASTAEAVAIASEAPFFPGARSGEYF